MDENAYRGREGLCPSLPLQWPPVCRGPAAGGRRTRRELGNAYLNFYF